MATSNKVKKTLVLNNGNEMPAIGLGTYKSSAEQLEKAIEDAIDCGYRHFDCAWFYGNEAVIGKAIKSKINEGVVKREELFITSKLWNNFHDRKNVMPTLKETLASLNLSYIDLYLIHWPFAFKEDVSLWPVSEGKTAYSDVDYLETWAALEECVALGLVRNVGVSNFNSEQIGRVLEVAKIRPVVNQVECNPNFNQKKLIEFCKGEGIVVTAYCPLGRSENAGMPGFPEPTIYDPKVAEIAETHNKTAAQVVLNYLLTLGVCVIPKSVTKSRILENFDIFDFELSEEEVQYLDSCNKNVRVCPLTMFADHPNYPFNTEY
ncbi:PREDICTED: aldose reductase-like [Nicrophorus vespilloides]|uniref:Aldose reductase-like n=1 Tax=Nicrophorus vespilloides TaxID=110193 RepID=A0ABM1MN29_NICVS|nr:PREDICTED: aldose reductase-like [Nicrophorus vespilloides]